MSTESDPIEALLASISDGRAVDWEHIARELDPAQRARLDALRELSKIAEFSRGLQREDGGANAPEHWGTMLLLERLGSGAHADVFRAWEPGLQREVALKLLRPGADGAALMGEGRSAARIRHPHVVTVHGIDLREDRIGLWMELVRGTSLEQVVRSRGPLAADEVTRLGLQVASAVSAVHAAGLLHRDIKPANVVVDAADRYVLADFGLGLSWDQASLAAAAPSGTPMYMAPELLSGGTATERSDVYSLGLLLWFVLAGRHPFDVTSLAELQLAAARGPGRTLRESRPDVPDTLGSLIERAIAPSAQARFASAREMLASLESLAEGVTQRRSTRGRRAAWLGVGIGVIVLGVFAYGAWRSKPVTSQRPADSPPVVSPEVTYDVEASLVRRGDRGPELLANGDRVKPGDRLSLDIRSTRPTWVYVLNEDDQGERYLLFPQPRFDLANPLAPDVAHVLPGPIAGRENAWTVTSAGEQEYFLVVAALQPVPELEAEISQLSKAEPGRPIEYARVGKATVERLRGVGGLQELPAGSEPSAPRSTVFDRFRALAGRETGVHGVWVRQIVLENPR
jgi:hypothetical protein